MGNVPVLHHKAALGSPCNFCRSHGHRHTILLNHLPRSSHSCCNCSQKAAAAGERIFRYDSLNEHLVMLSLSRAVRQREWRLARRLTLGWLLNHAFFTCLLLVFLVYGCEFEELSARDNSQLLMSSWAWSIMQRFVVNEPFIILIGVLLPILFASEFCANMCTESCNNVLGVALAMCITFLKRMRRV